MGDMNQAELEGRVKRMIVKAVKLKIPAESIESAKPLFGPDSVGLDSLDALELVIALEKEFGVRIPDSEVGRKVLVSVQTIVQYIQENKGGRSA
jgi:acyl carrier protein